MDPYMNAACPLVEHLREGPHVFPLAAPVGSNLLLPNRTPTFRCLGSAYAFTHKRQCSINVPLVESRIGLTDKALYFRHSFLPVDVQSGMHMEIPRNAPVLSAVRKTAQVLSGTPHGLALGR